jgi:HK97 gp10 family phage protein
MSKVSFESLIMKFAAMPELITKEIEKSMKKSAMKVRDDATKKFGEYQPAEGPYPAWAQLKESTIKEKEKAGGGDDPLIGHYPSGTGNHKRMSLKNAKDAFKRTGKWPMPLRSSIGIETEGLTAAVGTDDPIGKYHEYGTEHIPPRPFLRPALYENKDSIKNNVKEGIQNGIKAL